METLLREPTDLHPIDQPINRNLPRPNDLVDNNVDELPGNPRGGRFENELRRPVTNDGSSLPGDETTSNQTTQNDENQTTQNDVNQEKQDSQLSTDLESAFGSYGSYFADIINQLEQVLGGTAQDIFDISNVNGTSSSIFTQFISIIDRIARDTSSARASNVSNALTQVMSYYMSSISGLLQNQFNVEMWQIQQDYNSPKKQLERISDAGLNPLFAFGSDWSNVASGLESASLGTADAAPMQGDRTDAQKAMDITRQIFDGVDSVTSTVQGGFGIAQAAESLSQSAQHTQNDTDKTRQDISESKARVSNLQTTGKLLSQSYAFNEKANPMQLMQLWHQNRLVAAQADLPVEEKKKIEAETAQIIQATALEYGRFLRENSLTEVTLREMESRIALNYGSLQRTIEEASSIRSKRSYDEWTYRYSKQTGIPLGTPLLDAMAVKAASGQLQISELQNLSKFYRIIEGSKGNMSLYSLAGNLTSMLEQSVDTTLSWMSNMKTFGVESFRKFTQDWQHLDNAFVNIRSALKHPNGQNL